MKNIIRSLVFAACLLPGFAAAQTFPTVPDHSVVGRIGIGGSSGPSQSIPFTSLQPLLGGMLAANNLSDLTNKATARTNLGVAIGTNVEAWDTDLDCLAALSGTGILKRTGSGTCSASTVANADLANASTTVNGIVCTLGGTCTISATAASITVGTTGVASGTSGRVLFDNAGTLGEYVISGSGSVCMTTSCVMTTPNLGTPSAVTLTSGTGLPTTGLTGTLQAAQEPAHTGDVTNTAASLAMTIAANAVTNAKMATMAANTVKANATGSSAVPTDVTAAAARSSSLLNVDQFTGHGDSTYSILTTDRTVGTNASFTASRTWTLPAANAVNPGQEIIVADFQGTVTGSNTLIISRAGSDTVNGGASVTISSANGAYMLKSDGTSKWTAQALGAAAAGGVSSVTCGTGLSGGTITTSGTCAASLPTATNSLSADVLLNNTANYFDGPSMAQGTSGTWWASGSVTMQDTGSAAEIFCKLWDGTTVIASGDAFTAVSAGLISLHLSGFLASPAANIRISCRDSTNTTGKILFNRTGNSKDATISGVRLQ